MADNWIIDYKDSMLNRYPVLAEQLPIHCKCGVALEISHIEVTKRSFGLFQSNASVEHMVKLR